MVDSNGIGKAAGLKRLTDKEIARSDSGITIVSRQQSTGGFLVMAVRIDGSPIDARSLSLRVKHKSEVCMAAKEVARWLSKLGYPCWQMADAARAR